MSKEIEISANIKSNVGDLTKGVDKATDSTKKLQQASGKASGGFKGLGTAIKGIGSAIKTAGILVFATLIAKLVDVFRTNQKALDFFSTTMNSLGIAFNDLFRYLDDNYETIKGYLVGLFTDPLGELYKLGQGIDEFFTKKMKGAFKMIEGFYDLMTSFGSVEKRMQALAKISMGFVQAGKDIKEIYNIIEGRDLINHPYVMEKHRKHIDFNSFMTNLDNSNKRSYTKAVYLRMVNLKKRGNLTPFKNHWEVNEND